MTNKLGGIPGYALLLSSVALVSSCAPNYFTDPIPAPSFSKAYQGYFQGSFDSYGKLTLDGALSLPDSFFIAIQRENWGRGLKNDQEVTSFAAGRYWNFSNSNAAALLGFGFGSHRIDLKTGVGFEVAQDETFVGSNDFRKYFLDYSILYNLANGPFKLAIGPAARLNYLDQYRISESGLTVTYPASTDPNIPPDTSLSIWHSPWRSLQIEIAGEIDAGIEYVQAYSQVGIQIPFHDDQYPGQEMFFGSLGIRLLF